MSEGSSGSKPEDGQSAQEPWAARSNWVSGALGNGWVEVEPGIFRQIAPNDQARPARPVIAAFIGTQSFYSAAAQVIPCSPWYSSLS
jgi:hypothetical protein